MQLEPVERDAIVIADLALLLNAQDIAQVDVVYRPERRPRLRCGNREGRRVVGKIDLADEGVGRLDQRDAGQRQLLTSRSCRFWNARSERPRARGEQAPICSTPRCASARPTCISRSGSITLACGERK